MNKNIVYFLSPAIFILSLLFPKRRNRWCFGSWFGKKFDDNTKYLFEIANKDESIDAYWVTSEEHIYENLKKKELKVVLSTSWHGIYIQLTSRVFFCTVNSKDFLFSTLTPRNLFVQTWHGTPIKKIGFDVSYPIISQLFNYIRKHTIDNYDFVLSPSEKFDTIFKSAFRIGDEHILRSNCPRCDAFNIDLETINTIRSRLLISDTQRVIIYMPTHRNEGRDARVILSEFENLKTYNDSLKRKNIKVLLKLHPYDLKFKSMFKPTEHVGLYDERLEIDLYSLLASTDGLITDYSSVMFEYALLEKPIYLFIPDYSNYIKNERGHYFPLESVVTKPYYSVAELARGLLLDSDSQKDSLQLISAFNSAPTKNISAAVVKYVKEHLFDV